MDNTLTVYLSGRFRVLDPNGHDVTPKSSKGQGLLALLLTSPDMVRGRAWLQDKLWSDREPEQGSRSLRQELSQVKKALGEFGDLLTADRKTVSLDVARIKFGTPTAGAPSVFMEGIDIRDTEFNDWLTEERSARDTISHGAETSGTPTASFALIGLSSQSATCKVFEAQILEYAAKALGDICDVTIHRQLPNSLGSHGFIAGVQVFDVAGKETCVRITLERVSDAATLWSETVRGVQMDDPTTLDIKCLQLVNQLFERACRVALTGATAPTTPQSLAALAISKTFSIEKLALAEASRLLAEAFDLDPRGSFLAWRAQTMTIQFVERFETDGEALRDEGEKLCADALQMDPTNSNVLAATSNFRTIVERNTPAGLELARLAVRANDANPLAWWALSNAIQYTGHEEEAYIAAYRANLLSQGTNLEFWSAFQRSLAAMLVGETGEARHMGELSSALSPNFKPPLRYLGALYSYVDDVPNAERVFESLGRKEPDFSIDRLIQDPDYPVRLMRNAGLMDSGKLRKLKV